MVYDVLLTFGLRNSIEKGFKNKCWHKIEDFLMTYDLRPTVDIWFIINECLMDGND